MAVSVTDGDSENDFDLTLEEDELLSTLLSRVPAVPVTPAQVRTVSQTRSSTTHPTTGVARVAVNSKIDQIKSPNPIDIGFDLDSLTEEDLDFDESDLHDETDTVLGPEADPEPEPEARAEPMSKFRSHFNPQPNSRDAKDKRKLSPSVTRDDAKLASFVARTTAKSIPVAVASGPDINYPDLSRALSKLEDVAPIEAGLIASPGPPLEQEKEETLGASKPGIETPTKADTPLLRFRTFPRKPFSVSDLTAGAWCEQQHLYTLERLPWGRKTRTSAMKNGSKVHKKLEDEVYTTVKVDIAKKEDAFGLKLWNIIQGLRTLRDTGLTRELEIWGFMDDNLVNGIIDGLSYENPEPGFEEEVRSSQGSSQQSQGAAATSRKITEFFPSSNPKASSSNDEARLIYITDVKTRSTASFPSDVQERVTKVQLYFYHRFLSQMAADKLDYTRVFERYGLRIDEPFSDAFMAQIATLHGGDMFDDLDSLAGWSKESSSDYFSTVSSPSKLTHDPGFGEAAVDAGMLRFGSLRALVPLLRSEIRLTFPRGTESLAQLVSVEYRYRARSRHHGAEQEPDAEDGDEENELSGSVIGVNTYFVDDNVLDRYIAKELEWWRGERKPDGVKIEEAFKCRRCEFADDCEWRRAQEQALLKRAREKAPQKGKKVA